MKMKFGKNSSFLREALAAEKRIPIPNSIKIKVYERAGSRCENPKHRKPLEMKEGKFHHLSDPKKPVLPSKIEFLCVDCHNEFGHEIKNNKAIRTDLGQKIRTERHIVRISLRKKALKK
jgi:hypothetical protein